MIMQKSGHHSEQSHLFHLWKFVDGFETYVNLIKINFDSVRTIF